MRLAAILVALLLAACPTDETPDEPGTFVLHVPAADAMGVPPSTDITVQWTAPVEGVSVTVLRDSALVDGVLNMVEDGSVWAWLPDEELDIFVRYDVVIDWSGATEPRSFSFTTGRVPRHAESVGPTPLHF